MRKHGKTLRRNPRKGKREAGIALRMLGKMTRELVFSKEALLYDISSMAYVAGDIRADKMSAHSLHQTFDICEAGNIDRGNRLLSLAFSEVGLVMRGVTESPTARDVLSNSDPFPGEFRLMLSAGAGSEAWRIRVKEAVHEYLVARVLEGWLSVTLPEAAEFWKQLAEELRGDLTGLAASGFCGHRRLSPF